MEAEQDSTKRRVSVTDISYIIHGEGKEDDTIRVKTSRPSNTTIPITSKPPTATSATTPSSTRGLEDISPTSPSFGDPISKDALMLPKRKRAPSIPDRTLSSALRRLVSKPEPSKGSAHNPIILEEYSPRRKPMLLPKLQEPSKEQPKVQHERRTTYTSRPLRPALTQKSVNAGKVTGSKSSKSNDVSRMAKGKSTAIVRAPPAHQNNIVYGVPFEVQYPLSARFLAQQQALRNQYQSAYSQHPMQIGVSLHGGSEDMLRQKALWYIREHSRPQPHKMLSDDPDETSASETEHAISNHTSRIATSSPSKVKKLSVYQDPSDHISPLIAQSSLLNALWNIYPRSADKRGLREDIAMLVSVQNHNFNAWMKAESRKRRRVDVNSGIGNSSLVEKASKAVTDPPAVSRPLVEHNEEDNEVRSLLSAGAGMWQDGAGEALPEVFATTAHGPDQAAE